MEKKIQKTFALVFIGLMTVLWGITIITYIHDKHTIGFYIILLQFLLNFYTLIVMVFLHLETQKKLLPIYIVVVSLLSFPSLLIDCHENDMQHILWALINGVCLVVFYSNRKAVWWNICILGQIAAALLINALWGEAFIQLMEKEEYLTLCFLLGNNYAINALVIFSLFLYAVFCIVSILTVRQQTETHEIKKPRISNDLNCLLYEKIENYFDEQKPYLKSGFTLADLASALDSNTFYVGSAIKHNRNMSFSNFVNIYRINHAKKLLEGKDGKLYTLAHIYSASGFQNQPTFNRVFKENTGVTPSEYLARLRM